ncbi:MAG: hypothetical protein QNJ54_29480 [Prochloraceae cyanobacterium]|nr:hypothetical protein [Prochloraceae cyanobacterium]
MKPIKKLATGCLLTLGLAAVAIPVMAQSEEEKNQYNIHTSTLGGVIVAIPAMAIPTVAAAGLLMGKKKEFQDQLDKIQEKSQDIVQELQQQIEDEEYQLDRQTEINQSLEFQLQEKANSLSVLQQEIDRKQSELSVIQKKYEDLQRRIDEQQSKLGQQIAINQELENKYIEQTNFILSLQNTLNKHKLELVTREENNQNLEQELQAKTKEITKIKRHL